jgi:mannose-6-phosphate isomerase-like protein (cupin superfamily)
MTLTATMQPVVVRPGESRLPDLCPAGNEILVQVSPDDSGGQFAVGLMKVQPMGGPPLHVHSREDEWFYVLKGELTIQVGDERITAGPGTSVFGPRGVPHTFQNFTGEVVETLVMVNPPAFLDFFAEVSRPMQPAEFEDAAAGYGLQFVGPPLAA